MVCPVPGLFELVWQAAFWYSMFIYWVGLGFQARHICWVTQGESFSRLIPPPGSSIKRGLVLRCPPTEGVAHWSNVTAPWALQCTGVWTAPKQWKSYSWNICTSLSRVAPTLLRGGWISFSVYPPTPYPVSHQQRRRRKNNGDVSGGRPPGTSFYFTSLPPECTYILSLINMI